LAQFGIQAFPPWFYEIALCASQFAFPHRTSHLVRMSDPDTRLNTALEGRYVLEREIGPGSMAIVYLAERRWRAKPRSYSPNRYYPEAGSKPK
jgi:hypothetical protein